MLRIIVPALTEFRRHAAIETEWPAGRYTRSRYSLLELNPRTGRFHQIRKHLASLAHPIIGDTVYGDSRHNRVFREKLGISDLLLIAKKLEFSDPLSGVKIEIMANWSASWRKLFEEWQWPSDF